MRTTHLNNAESIELYQALSRNQRGIKKLNNYERKIVKVALDNMAHRSTSSSDISNVRSEVQAIIEKLQKDSKHTLPESRTARIMNKMLNILGLRVSAQKIYSKLDKVATKKSDYQANLGKLKTIQTTITNIKKSLQDDTDRSEALKQTIQNKESTLKNANATKNEKKQKLFTDKTTLKVAGKTIADNKKRLKKLKREEQTLIKKTHSEQNKIAHSSTKEITSIEDHIQNVLKTIWDKDQKIKDLYNNQPKMVIQEAEKLLYRGAKENPRDPNNKQIIHRYESKIEQYEKEVKIWEPKIKEIKKSLDKDKITLKKLKNQKVQLEKENAKFLNKQKLKSESEKKLDLESDWEFLEEEKP